MAAIKNRLFKPLNIKILHNICTHTLRFIVYNVIKRPARDACLCMGDLQAPPAPHFVFLITL